MIMIITYIVVVDGVVVIVELPQTPEDAPQMTCSCALNADESITVAAWV